MRLTSAWFATPAAPQARKFAANEISPSWRGWLRSGSSSRSAGTMTPGSTTGARARKPIPCRAAGGAGTARSAAGKRTSEVTERHSQCRPASRRLPRIARRFLPGCFRRCRSRIPGCRSCRCCRDVGEAEGIQSPGTWHFPGRISPTRRTRWGRWDGAEHAQRPGGSSQYRYQEAKQCCPSRYGIEGTGHIAHGRRHTNALAGLGCVTIQDPFVQVASSSQSGTGLEPHSQTRPSTAQAALAAGGDAGQLSSRASARIGRPRIHLRRRLPRETVGARRNRGLPWHHHWHHHRSLTPPPSSVEAASKADPPHATAAAAMATRTARMDSAHDHLRDGSYRARHQRPWSRPRRCTSLRCRPG